MFSKNCWLAGLADEENCLILNYSRKDEKTSQIMLYLTHTVLCMKFLTSIATFRRITHFDNMVEGGLSFFSYLKTSKSMSSEFLLRIMS